MESHGFENRLDGGLTAILKKDFGPHSFHINAAVEWTGDESEYENLRKTAFSLIVGHDMPLTTQLVLVSDVVWRQAEDRDAKDVWMFETGVRAQLTPSLIGAVGIGVGLDPGEETPDFAVTVGFQFGL